jgi:hypothetical protein
VSSRREGEHRVRRVFARENLRVHGSVVVDGCARLVRGAGV